MAIQVHLKGGTVLGFENATAIIKTGDSYFVGEKGATALEILAPYGVFAAHVFEYAVLDDRATRVDS